MEQTPQQGLLEISSHPRGESDAGDAPGSIGSHVEGWGHTMGDVSLEQGLSEWFDADGMVRFSMLL